MSVLSAATRPTGVVQKAPRAPRPMRLVAARRSPSMPFLRFHVSSDAYNKVPWAAASWRLRAEAGCTPYLVVSRRILASVSSPVNAPACVCWYCTAEGWGCPWVCTSCGSNRGMKKSQISPRLQTSAS